MTNKQIRTQAWALFRANYGKMLPAVAIVQFFTFLPLLIYALFPVIGACVYSVSQLGTILVAPIAQCGAAAYALDILDGSRAQDGAPVRPRGRPRKIGESGSPPRCIPAPQ
jgi:hypothetical protein